MALEVYRVESMFGSIDEAALGTDIWEALDGRIPILERLDERVRVYESSSKAVSPQPVEIARVSFDNESSATATVVEVAAADSLGLLCRLAHALSEQELDITRSKVQTLGEQAVDSFYVRDLAGHKITDAGAIGAIRAGVLHSLGQPEPAT